MNTQQLRALLAVQRGDGPIWTAFLPELPGMCAAGPSEDEAGRNWLREYDWPESYPVFDLIQLKRAEVAELLKDWLHDVQYRLPCPTIVSVSFANDDDNAAKLWRFERMIREIYGAYGTGPASLHVPGQTNFLSFGFRKQEDLDLARQELGLPTDLQAGPPVYIGPQPERGKKTTGKKEILSPCHQARIEASRADGVTVGSCSVCYQDVVRVNPHTGKQEWLDGHSPWSQRELRPVE